MLVSTHVHRVKYLLYRPHAKPMKSCIAPSLTNEVLYCQCCGVQVVLASHMALTLPTTPSVSMPNQVDGSLMLSVALEQVQRTLWVQAPARGPSLLSTRQRL